MKKSKNKYSRRKRTSKSSWWGRYEYKHTTLVIVSVSLFVLALDTAIVQALLESIKGWGLAGIVVAGLLFVSFFTAVPAVVLLISLSDQFNPITIAFYAAIGSAIGDWIILKIFEERVAHELLPLARKLNIMPFIRRLRRKKARERTLLLGMVAIASPLPDELGLAMLGISRLPTVSLLVITFLLNAAGILLLVLAT